ncbi:MAG: glutamine synthetase III [Clostridia bacterium]|nr:glutamine synthetase III [Clostridia bacterium]
MNKITEYFGTMVFNDNVRKEMLPPEAYKSLQETIENGTSLDISLANVVASAMKEWAIEKGATHYTHWFQPMTGITAEKHDSFFSLEKGTGKIIVGFSGKDLITSEPDASSFPSGGLRATFEARGCTAWDPTSDAFVKNDTLYIPSAFCSYGGECLDRKTPLLRSIQALDVQAKRLLKHFGIDARRVVPMVGGEQEYFLIDEEYYHKREDLKITGKTLFGATAPKGQELDDHYFGVIPFKVKNFMTTLDRELWMRGIPAKTEHNEAAPCQYELAPIFTDCNRAIDQNQLTMDIMKKAAKENGLRCLLAEKPFNSVNGSGKHNNWSLSADGKNLLAPGKDMPNNKLFLLMICAVLKGVDTYQDLIRISVATAGNDKRLGGYEAPPAIISIFLGKRITDALKSFVNGSSVAADESQQLPLGVNVLPQFANDGEDRNRTSPFAFTGNKFEFRMPGSSMSIAMCNTVINTVVAESLCEFANILDNADDVSKTIDSIIADTYYNHKRIIFNGNNYSEEWVREAERRGLLNLSNTAMALPHYVAEKNVKLFGKHGILNEKEMLSRYDVMLDEYSKTVNVDGATMVHMARRRILPAVSSYVASVCDNAEKKKAMTLSYQVEYELALKLNDCAVSIYNECESLSVLLDKAKDVSDKLEKAQLFASQIIPCMDRLRAAADTAELYVPKDVWPFPTYTEILL